MESSNPKGMHEANRRSWNAATKAHNSHKHDQAGFLRHGGSTLRAEELALLGDVDGKRVVHLQCNSGQDSLSLAQRGAMVTGVDISDEAIDCARALSRDSEIAAEFCRADVYDWLAEAENQNARFDVVFCSYGALCWLSNLNAWARGIQRILVPGGAFVTVEFHPMSMVFDEHYALIYPYFGLGKPLVWDDGITDYVAKAGASLAPSGFETGERDFKNPYPSYEFQWHIGAILSAILRAGLRIECFEEYPYSNGAKLFDDMRELPDGRIYPPEHLPSIPLMFGLRAVKPQ